MKGPEPRLRRPPGTDDRPELARLGDDPSADVRLAQVLRAANFKKNKAVRVTFSGGLLGLILGSSRGKVDEVLKRQNADDWNLAQVMPDNPNLAIWLLRLLILVATLGLWTLSTGYIFIFEKPR